MFHKTMMYDDHTFETPEENLACDEALLEACEQKGIGVLRFWEPSSFFVVLGFSSAASREVHVELCHKEHIPILRRLSGGCAVLLGPGCLNFTLILNIAQRKEFKSPTQTSHFILSRHRQALELLSGKTIEIQGFGDLVLNGKKFSGSAQRRKREALLFHGTFLLHFPLQKMDAYLKMPPRQPSYRENRPHHAFLTNLNVPAEKIIEALRRVWGAHEPLEVMPRENITRLVSSRYALDSWNYRL